MELTINGNLEKFDRVEITVSDLLLLKEIKMPEMVSVQLNGEMVERESFGSMRLKAGDEVDFLYFMGGGRI